MEKKKSRATMIINGEIEPSTPYEKTMLNLRNRRSFDKMDEETHREISRKGGQATAEMYGEKKTARKALENILTLKVTDTMFADADISQELIAKLKRSDPNATIYDLLNAVAVGKAMDGNLKAYELIRDTYGDKPTEKVDISGEIVTDADRALLESISHRLQDGDRLEIVRDV